jgi:Flp pilus assembly protein TadG
MSTTHLDAPDLGGDSRGTTLVEFGLLAPVLLLLLMGFFDVGHSLFMRAMLEGEVQRASRDSGLETGTAAANQTAIDNKVKEQLRALGITNGDISINRRFYRSFSEAAAAQAEPFTDTDGNGRCNGEPFTDRNNNGVRDLDGGDAGQGGAKDSVLYTVTVSYDRMFPLRGMIGLPAKTTLTASTLMSNQPYGEQGSYTAPTVRNCPP